MDAKSFLHAWCNKKGFTPTFEVRATGPKHRQRFLCEVRVPSLTYVAAGNSTTKKEAQANASKDFVNFLVRNQHVDQKDLSSIDTALDIKPLMTTDNDQPDNHNNYQQQSQPNRPVFQDGMGPNEMGQAYRAWNRDNHQNQRPFTYVDRMQQAKQVEEAEDLDVNAAIHGNWTIENAKSKLHQYMQSNKINSDYVFKAIGPHHTRFDFLSAIQ